MAPPRPTLTVYFEEWLLHTGGAEVVKLNSGVLFPTPWTAHIAVDQGPWWLEMGFVVIDGEPALQRFLVSLGPRDRWDNPPVRTLIPPPPRTLIERSADIGPSLSTELVRRLAGRWAVDEVIRQGAQWTAIFEQKMREGLEQIGQQAIPRHRRLSPDLLRFVADIAKQKQNKGRATKAVAERLHTSHRNATRWIAAARSGGYLNSEEED